jgi:hypothetical protein
VVGGRLALRASALRPQSENDIRRMVTSRQK